MSDPVDPTMLETISNNSPIILSAIIGSSITTAIVSYLLRKKEKKIEDTNHKNYLALKVANHLENYAIECAKAINLSELYHASDELEGRPIYNIPNLPQLPSDENYKLIEAGLLDKVFGLFNELEIRQMSIEFDPEINDLDDNQRETIPQTALLASKGLSISKEFRSKYKLQARNLDFNQWHIVEYLRRKHST